MTPEELDAPEFAEHVPSAHPAIGRGRFADPSNRPTAPATAWSMPVEIHAKILDFDGRPWCSALPATSPDRKRLEQAVMREAHSRPGDGIPQPAAVLRGRGARNGPRVRYRPPLAVLMLDLDRFKRVNDRFGSQRAMPCCWGACRLASQSLRDTDILGRLGGEEFAACCWRRTGRRPGRRRHGCAGPWRKWPCPSAAGLRCNREHPGPFALHMPGTTAFDAHPAPADAALYAARRRAATGDGWRAPPTAAWKDQNAAGAAASAPAEG